MMCNGFGEGDDCLRFFHVCTDGENNGIIHLDDPDYRYAVVLSAVTAFRSGVRIVCFCHMSTHSHFVIHCHSPQEAKQFADSYKRDYSRYMYLEHGLYCTLRGVDVTVIEINDRFYLKNCISYVLNNPVAAKICRHPEDYPWSSFKAYFTNKFNEGRPIETLKDCEVRRIFRTRSDLTKSGFRIDGNDNPVLTSIVDYVFVQKLYGGTSEFYRSLALTDSVREEERYLPQRVKYTDNELLAEAMSISGSKFNLSDFSCLSRDQKVYLAGRLARKTNASQARISRILRLSHKQNP